MTLYDVENVLVILNCILVDFLGGFIVASTLFYNNIINIQYLVLDYRINNIIFANKYEIHSQEDSYYTTIIEETLTQKL